MVSSLICPNGWGRAQNIAVTSPEIDSGLTKHLATVVSSELGILCALCPSLLKFNGPIRLQSDSGRFYVWVPAGDPLG